MLKILEGEYKYIKKILELNDLDKIKLNIPAISASENQIGGKLYKSFNQFKKYVYSLGIKKVEFLFALGQFDVTYFEYCVYAQAKMIKLLKAIYEIYQKSRIYFTDTTFESIICGNDQAKGNRYFYL